MIGTSCQGILLIDNNYKFMLASQLVSFGDIENHTRFEKEQSISTFFQTCSRY